ncbi:MAG: DUF2779 domain-containing protein [Candidatus Bathyarchaeota archaeon]|nr:DUF2779 domain-containing protein [Candidatus Bathyarchaeota archaeon]
MRSGQVSETPALGEKFRMEQGLEIGRRARKIYPEGVLIDDPDLASASKKTKGLMGDSSISTIFEGTFLVNNFVAKADILKRKNDDSWHMIEVKSSVIDKAEFIDDMAYTTMVIDSSGSNISNISLMLVSKDFRLGMKNKALFVEIDHTEEVQDRVEKFKPFWEPVEKITRMPEKPEPKLCFECRGCGLFKECLGRDIENHIFDIPRLSQSKFDKLTESGINCIEDIPDEFSLTQNQDRVKNCVKSKKPFIRNELKNELGRISWPASFLDFETVMTAMPLYPDIAPYTQIPTQYSIHKCSEPGHIIDHLHYLADPSKDCRREIAEHLITYLKGEGSIIAYSDFEKRIIANLGSTFPDLSEELNLLINRLVDLNAIVRKNFYHPEFHGSTSIKTVLPILVPDISYDELKIADGDSASAAFAYLALGKYENTEVESVRSCLLEYCKQDTLAEVRLHQRLCECI